jgi:hypothetical protein
MLPHPALTRLTLARRTLAQLRLTQLILAWLTLTRQTLVWLPIRLTQLTQALLILTRLTPLLVRILAWLTLDGLDPLLAVDFCCLTGTSIAFSAVTAYIAMH